MTNASVSVSLSSNKVIVFDMDETLGYFVELGIFWDALQHFYKKHKLIVYDAHAGAGAIEEAKSINIQGLKSKDHFCKVLDLFPEFIRPDMNKMLEYILSKKNDNHCDKVIIYTNNQGPKNWANMISAYFEYHLQKPVFDKVIGAFKVKGKHIELDRTTHDKTVDDLKRCAKLYEKTDICFLDDQYHPHMKNENVYYINVKPYVYQLKYADMAERYYNAFNIRDLFIKSDFIHEITAFMNEFKYTVTNKTPREYSVDKFISQRMMYHLKCFFNEAKHPRNKTIKKVKRRVGMAIKTRRSKRH